MTPGYILLRESLRTTLRSAFTKGTAQPLTIPYSILGAFIVPCLYLSIPHTQRPWLYSLRWAVMAFVVLFDAHVVASTSSTNMACAYATGLMAAWGIVSNANLLLCMRVQEEAARVVRRMDEGGEAARMNGHTMEKDVETKPALVWEPFPAEASLAYRLGWVLDLACNFRGAGWNHSIHVIPHAKLPGRITPGLPVDLGGMPLRTSSGYTRCTSQSELVRTRVWNAAVAYLVLDFLAVFMTKDPYFVFGPGHEMPLPWYLLGVSSRLLALYRQLFVGAGIMAALAGSFALNDLVHYFILSRWSPRLKELWLYPSGFGDAVTILDRGLSGFWGCFWHQTFRAQFAGPSLYLARQGWLRAKTQRLALVAVFIAFAQSGLLHACGSTTSIPPTMAWRSPAFFFLQALGIALQRSLSTVARRFVPCPSKTLVRGANLAFAALWLHYTAGFFLDDLASTGLWLFEPVPVSPLRWLGVGHDGDSWWRWDREFLPRLHVGGHWWQSGVAL